MRSKTIGIITLVIMEIMVRAQNGFSLVLTNQDIFIGAAASIGFIISGAADQIAATLESGQSKAAARPKHPHAA